MGLALLSPILHCCALDTRSSQHVHGDHRQASRVPFARRHLGRHHDTARPSYAHRARRFGGIRTRPDSCAHRRRPRPRQGARLKLGRKPKLMLHQNQRASRAPQTWRRNTCRDRPQLQCKWLDDFEAVIVKTKSLKIRVCRAAELAVRARIHLDYFVFLKDQKNIDAFENVLGEYWDFFRFSRLSHEFSFYIRINNLLTSKKDTDNLPELRKELRDKGLITPSESDHICSMLTKINPVRKSVKKICDKAVAHQDDTLSQPEVYRQANLNLPKLIELSDKSLEIANRLCTACALPTQKFLPNQIEHLRTMLEALRETTACP